MDPRRLGGRRSLTRGSSRGVQPGDAQFWFDERVEPGRQSLRLRVSGCPPAAAAWSSRPCSNPRCMAATHLGVGSGQIPYGAGVQPNDPFPSDDLLAVSRQRCHWFGFSSQFGVEPHPVEDLGGEHRSSIQRVTRLPLCPYRLGPQRLRRANPRSGRPIAVRRAGHGERVFAPSLRAPSRESRRVSGSPGAPRRRGIRCVDDPRRPGISGCVRSLPHRTTRPGGSARW